MSPVLPILIIDGLLLVIAAWLSHDGSESAATATLAAAGLIVLGQIALFASLPAAGRMLRVEILLRRPHLIQTPLQILLYCYWGLYWPDVGRYVPFLLAQLVFAWALEMLLSWFRYRCWRFGLGPVPVILSLNLFLWMKEEYAICQFGLIVLAYAGREFVTWQRDGRRRHIFNPSAFALTIVSLALILTDSVEISRGVDIVGSFDLPPGFFEVVFLLGVVPQLVFLTTWTTFGTVATLAGLYFAVKWGAGVQFGPTPFDPSVFLGATLLVTDPATSPSSRSGRLLFGLAYGAGIFVSCIILRLVYVPAFFDKILVVPVVNLLVPWFERSGDWLASQLHARAPAGLLRLSATRWFPVAVYSALVVAILPPLKQPDYSRRSPLPPPAVDFSPSVSRNLLVSHELRQQLPEVYRPFAFRSEWKYYDLVSRQFQTVEPATSY